MDFPYFGNINGQSNYGMAIYCIHRKHCTQRWEWMTMTFIECQCRSMNVFECQCQPLNVIDGQCKQCPSWFALCTFPIRTAEPVHDHEPDLSGSSEGTPCPSSPDPSRSESVKILGTVRDGSRYHSQNMDFPYFETLQSWHILTVFV